VSTGGGGPGQRGRRVGTRGPGAGTVARSTGRVFFTLDGTDYSCSGSAVASANASVVVTAAHCVRTAPAGGRRNWVFVPGYRDGRQSYGVTRRAGTSWRPVGSTAATKTTTSPSWRSNRPGWGRRAAVADVVGGQRIGSATGHDPAAFGYPADPRTTAGQLDYCAGCCSRPYGSADAGIECR